MEALLSKLHSAIMPPSSSSSMMPPLSKPPQKWPDVGINSSDMGRVIQWASQELALRDNKVRNLYWREDLLECVLNLNLKAEWRKRGSESSWSYISSVFSLPRIALSSIVPQTLHEAYSSKCLYNSILNFACIELTSYSPVIPKNWALSKFCVMLWTFACVSSIWIVVVKWTNSLSLV